MIFWTILLLAIAACLAIFLYLNSKLDTFKQSGIPHIKPLPILGNMGPIIFNKSSLPQMLANFYNSRSGAKYYGFYEFTNPVVVICDPELVKSIGIKSFDTFTNRRGFAEENQDPILGLDIFSLKDERWHQMRNLLSPSFTSSKMKSMFRIMFQQAEEFVNHTLKEKKSVEVEMRKLFQKLIIDVMAACAYGISTNCVKDQQNDLYILGPRAVNLERLERKKFLLFKFPALWKMFGMTFLDNEITKFFRNIVDSTIAEREKNKPFLPNMIHLMIDGADKNKNISIEEMTAEVYIFFLAAFHTSSGMLTYLYYDLAVNPEIQERLQEEIDSLQEEFSRKQEDGNTIVNEEAYKDVNNLKFLDAVLKESMRLHTMVPILERTCSQDFTLPPALPGAKPFTLKPGTLLWIPAQAIHEDPNYYDDPKKFNPDRFLNEDEKIVLNTPTYMPFGIGPRNCIAYRFAMLIFKVVVFHFFARCSVKVCSKTPIPLNMTNKTLTNIVENEIWLEIEERTKRN